MPYQFRKHDNFDNSSKLAKQFFQVCFVHIIHFELHTHHFALYSNIDKYCLNIITFTAASETEHQKQKLTFVVVAAVLFWFLLLDDSFLLLEATTLLPDDPFLLLEVPPGKEQNTIKIKEHILTIK